MHTQTMGTPAQLNLSTTQPVKRLCVRVSISPWCPNMLQVRDRKREGQKEREIKGEIERERKI